MPERNPLDIFRRVLAGAARAIARDPEIEVAFASDAGPASGKVARVPSPGPGLERRLVAEARGSADALALRLRHHDARLHAANAPADPEARGGVRRAGNRSRRSARRAVDGRGARQPRRAGRGAGEGRRDRPRAHRRRSAAGDGDRPDRAQADDRRRAAGAGARRARACRANGSRTRPRPNSMRWP